jgi:hypothetical protein
MFEPLSRVKCYHFCPNFMKKLIKIPKIHKYH